MNKYFNKIKLGELTEIIAGGDKPKIFSENKTSINTVPVFANAEGNNGLQGYTNLPRIIEPAVTISARGSKVGFAALRKQPFFPIVRLLTLIPQKDKLDVDYLFYNLKLNRQNGTGSGQPQITIPEISDKIISVPPLFTQQKIASVLSALDAKIELNNRINAELEAMAKTLYDYWFVQFDFPDKNGKPYKTNGGKMVWNEELKREIPEGWEDGTFENYCPSTGGFAFKSNWWTSEGVAVAKIKDIKENYTLDTSDLARVDMSDKEIDDKFLAKAGDVLIAMTGATVGKYAIVPITDYPIYVNQRVGYFSLGKDPTNLLPFLINSMNQSYFRYAIFTLANGAAQPNISNNQINSIQLLLPDKKLIEQYNEMFKPYYKKIINNQLENQKLTELRDWLLPMLMNGQVKVN
jgi:type I restriction enzyme S subunit